MKFDFSKFKTYTPTGRRDRPEIMNLSGGRSSAYVLMMLKNGGFGKDGDMAIFDNTGCEDESCLVFLRDLQSVVEFPIVFLEYTLTDRFFEELVWSSFSYEKFFNCQYDHIGQILNLKKLHDFKYVKSPKNEWYLKGYGDSLKNFKQVDYKSASRIGKPFIDAFLYKSAIRIMKREGLIVPNASQRWCTGDLKEKTTDNFLKNILGDSDYISYVGMRHDEPKRVHKVFIKNNHSGNIYYDCPAHWEEVTKRDVVKAFEEQPFDLGRTFGSHENCYLDFIGNCGACILKARIKKLYIAQNKPQCFNLFRQIEIIAGAYNGDNDSLMSRQHGSYDSILKEANEMPKISIKEVLSDHEVEYECFNCGD